MTHAIGDVHRLWCADARPDRVPAHGGENRPRRGEAIGGGLMAVASVAIGFSLELMPELSWPGTLFLIAGSVIVMFRERKKRADSAQ